MSDNDERIFFGVRNPDGSYDNVELPHVVWTFYEPEPCPDCQQAYKEVVTSYEVSFTFELSPQMQLAFYRMLFPGLVEHFGDSIN